MVDLRTGWDRDRPPKERESKNKPKVITLCGSTRFTDEMLIKQWELTKQGYVVLSWCALPEGYYVWGPDKSHIADHEGVREIVNEGHKRKIDISDEVLVINVGGYIGEDTASEIEYAMSLGLPIKYLEEEDKI